MSFAGHFATHRIAWSRAFIACALAYILLASPPKVLAGWPAELVEMLGYALLVAATLWRIWCLVFIGGSKNEELAQLGPYSMVRNPLYIGNFLGAVGFGFAVEMPYLALVFAAAFTLLYPAVVAREEARLLDLFGDRYQQYCARVPRWVPDFALYREPETVAVAPRQIRKGIFDAMWFLWAFALWEFVEMLHETGVLPTLF